MSTILPVNDPEAHRKPPWLLHALDVNTLNFCSFSMCYHHSLPGVSDEEILRTNEGPPPILIAVPNAINSDSIDILQFTQGNRISTVPADKSTKTGMLMALRLLYRAGQLTVVAGYEGGHVSVYQRGVGDVWRKTYSCQPHSQPVLSLDVAYSNEWFITSSADATIVKHPLLPESSIGIEAQPLQVMQTKHSGQQGVQVRSDSKVFATAGWDARVRVYSSKTMKELAVLKWHQDGCYAIAFAAVATSSVQMDERKNEDASEEGIQNQVSTSEQSLLGGVERRRSEKAQSTHWLAAGSKDGKVSLWDIY
ncbi:MAG: ASTRA complex subunit [Pycnora praestabilis]|nr:MAG: ASTRA complex subunit [Pycnora praestabilis]